MTSVTSSISINRKILVHSIELVNGNKFSERANFSKLVLNEFLRLTFEKRCEMAVKLAEIEYKK